MNNWAFTGNLGGDCETRFTKSGEPVVSFSVGVRSGYGDMAMTSWARCSMFGKRGESVAPYLLKGQLVGVVGEVTMRPYTNREGDQAHSLDVRVQDLTLLGKKDAASAPEKSAPSANPASDDIPF